MTCFYSESESALNGRLLKYLVTCSFCLFLKSPFCGVFSPRTVGESKSIIIDKNEYHLPLRSLSLNLISVYLFEGTLQSKEMQCFIWRLICFLIMCYVAFLFVHLQLRLLTYLDVRCAVSSYIDWKPASCKGFSSFFCGLKRDQGIYQFRLWKSKGVKKFVFITYRNTCWLN